MICVFVSQALNKSKKAQVSSHTHTHRFLQRSFSSRVMKTWMFDEVITSCHVLVLLQEVEALLSENEMLQGKLHSQEDDFRLQNSTLMTELSKVTSLFSHSNHINVSCCWTDAAGGAEVLSLLHHVTQDAFRNSTECRSSVFWQHLTAALLSKVSAGQKCLTWTFWFWRLLCLSSGLHPSEEHLKSVPVWRLLQMLLLHPVPVPLRSFVASHIPRFFVCPKKKKEREKWRHHVA